MQHMTRKEVARLAAQLILDAHNAESEHAPRNFTDCTDECNDFEDVIYRELQSLIEARS